MKTFKLTGLALIIVAVIFAGCDREISGDVKLADNSSTSCFDCHSDTEFTLVAAQAQFANSIHNSAANTSRNRLYSSRYASCEKCHTSEGFIAEVTGVPADGDFFTAFDCFTCHAPHSEGDFSVRVNSGVTLQNGAVYDKGASNICVSCHQSRRNVDDYVAADVVLSSHWGPHHSNQGDMLAGTNAYEYIGYDYTGSWHETGATNGCVSCHMSSSLHETIGGHSWNMMNEEHGWELITGCNIDGCHSANPVASVDRETVFDFDGDGVDEGVQQEMHDMLDSLQVLLEAAGFVDSTGHPISDVVISTADSAGALYNFLFVEEDRSVGVHNTGYAVALMQSAINFLNTGDPNGSPSGKPEERLTSEQ